MRKRIFQGVLSFVLAGAVLFFVLPQIADLVEVWKQIQAMTSLEIAVLVLVAIWNLVTYWILLVICTPGLTYPQAVVVAESTTAVANTVPAGGAVSLGLTYAMLGSWGFSKSRITLSVLVSGIWNNFAKLAMPIVAVSLLALEGGAGGGRILSALIGFGALDHRGRRVRAHPAERGVRGAHRERHGPARHAAPPGHPEGSGRGLRPRGGQVPVARHRAGAPPLAVADVLDDRRATSRSTRCCSPRCARSGCRTTR